MAAFITVTNDETGASQSKAFDYEADAAAFILLLNTEYDMTGFTVTTSKESK